MITISVAGFRGNVLAAIVSVGKQLVLNILCVCVCSLSYPARTVSCPVLSCVAVPHLSTLSHKRHDFRKRKKLLKIKYLFFSPQILSEIFLILGKIQRDAIINVWRPSCRVLFILVKFDWKLSFVDRFSKNAPISNFMKIRSHWADFHEIQMEQLRSMGAELFHLNWWTDGRTDGQTERQTWRS
jgi:hypothetical protein